MSRQRCLVVAIAVAVHRIQNADVVNHRTKIRKQVTDPRTTLSVLLELPARSNQESFELARLVQPA